MREATEDPAIVIIARGIESVVYQCGDERWIIYGTCNRCGACEVGTFDREIFWLDEPGEPGACFDMTHGKRRDIPMRPEGTKPMFPSCSLTGEYL